MQQEELYSILRDKALADGQRFVFPYVSTGKLNKEQLSGWLAAFNRWLLFAGEQVTEERDYRRQFAAWFRQRNPLFESPDRYTPENNDKSHARIVAMPGEQIPLYSDSPQPSSAKTIPLPVAYLLRDEHSAKGKFSKGDNKYDMHWLKNLRDEVRSMGG